jgi:hypothetical protein
MKNPFPVFYILGPLPWNAYVMLPRDDDQDEQPAPVKKETPPDMSNVVVMFKPKSVANDYDNDPESA